MSDAAVGTAAAPITVAGPSGRTSGAARRGGRRDKGKSRAGAGGGGDGDGEGEGNGSRPLRDRLARPSFAFCVKCVAETALRPPVDTVPMIECDWDCTNSVSCALCKDNGKTCFQMPRGIHGDSYQLQLIFNWAREVKTHPESFEENYEENERLISSWRSSRPLYY